AKKAGRMGGMISRAGATMRAIRAARRGTHVCRHASPRGSMKRLPVLVALLGLPAAHETAAQSRSPLPVAVRASSAPVSGVAGVVVDEDGAGVDGVSILAMGTTLAMVRTDDTGRFSLRLPPGPYVLRATRDGYISTYRELIDVRREITISRSITLIRAAGLEER